MYWDVLGFEKKIGWPPCLDRLTRYYDGAGTVLLSCFFYKKSVYKEDGQQYSIS